MTTSFTASNGIGIKADPDGIMIQIHPTMPWRYMDGFCPGTLQESAIAEYYQHQRDTELGRWRSKEYPDCVVYPVEGKTREVRVTNEATGVTRSYRDHPDYLEANAQTRTLVAREYFAAHPEPAPEWHDAAENDIWLLDGADHPGTLKPYQTVIDTDGETVQGPRFFPAYRTEWTPGAYPNEFTTGRRIWPEGQSDE